jgi:hypothetical protein
MYKDWKGISAPDENREGTGEVEKQVGEKLRERDTAG